MKDILYNIREWWDRNRLGVVKFIKEHIAIIGVVVAFLLYPYVARLYDPTAAAFDPGYLHSVFAALVAFAVFQWVTWSVIKNIWPAIGQYLKSGIFNNDFKDMAPDTKVRVTLCVYGALLAILAFLFNAIL